MKIHNWHTTVPISKNKTKNICSNLPKAKNIIFNFITPNLPKYPSLILKTVSFLLKTRSQFTTQIILNWVRHKVCRPPKTWPIKLLAY